MPKWEYATHTIDVQGVFTSGAVDVNRFNHDLNWYGQQGWEMVAAFDTNTTHGMSRNVVFIFKRSLAEEPPVLPASAVT